MDDRYLRRHGLSAALGRLVNGKQAWAVLGIGILIYEATCADGQLLSEIVDGWLVTRPIVTRAVIAVVALHLANGIMPDYDPLHWGFKLTRRWRTVTTVIQRRTSLNSHEERVQVTVVNT